MSPSSSHAERYRLRTEPWTPEAARLELVRRLEQATGLSRERCHELADAHGDALSVTLSGELRADGHLTADPFAKLVGRLAALLDAEGHLPEPRSVEETMAAQRKQVGY